MNTANGTVLMLYRQLANLDKGRDARQIILRQSDDIAFAQALHQQVEEWLQASRELSGGVCNSSNHSAAAFVATLCSVS